MAVRKIETITADDYLEMKDLPESCELIDGVILAMSPSPSYRHNAISVKIEYAIQSYINRNKGKCNLFHAPADVKLNDENVVQPDIFVTYSPDEKIKGHCHYGAPDFVIEIVSPFGASRDYFTKRNLYKRSGVREYWIVNPMDESVTVYFFEKDEEDTVYSFDDSVAVNIYAEAEEKLEICINKL